MREIKFRIWNGSEMVHDIVAGKFGTFYVNPGAKGDGLDENDSASLTRANTKYYEPIHAMQFTGLKDKNGKEIYEGDILGYWGGNPNGASWIVGWDENKSGWATVYGETDITNMGESMSGRPAFKLSKKLCEKKEIIGNIYENPDLIK